MPQARSNSGTQRLPWCFWSGLFLEQGGPPLCLRFPLLLAAGALGGNAPAQFLAWPLLLCTFGRGFLLPDTDLVSSSAKRKGIRDSALAVQNFAGAGLLCAAHGRALPFEKQGRENPCLLGQVSARLEHCGPPRSPGIFHMKFRRFPRLLMLLGAIFWAGTYLGPRLHLLAGQIEFIALKSQQLGGGLMVLLVASLAFYIGLQIRGPPRDSCANWRIARIRPGRVEGKTGTPVNLSRSWIYAHFRWTSRPTRKRFPAHFRHGTRVKLQQTDERLPRDREVILYCT